MLMTGCFSEEKYDEELIGVWDNAIGFDGGWMINSYSFFGDGRCSIYVAITTDYEIRDLAYDECRYELDGTDRYIDGEKTFLFDVENNYLYTDNGTKYNHVVDDPCKANFNKC
jgi:hypothetical protein